RAQPPPLVGAPQGTKPIRLALHYVCCGSATLRREHHGNRRARLSEAGALILLREKGAGVLSPGCPNLWFTERGGRRHDDPVGGGDDRKAEYRQHSGGRGAKRRDRIADWPSRRERR